MKNTHYIQKKIRITAETQRTQSSQRTIYNFTESLKWVSNKKELVLILNSLRPLRSLRLCGDFFFYSQHNR